MVLVIYIIGLLPVADLPIGTAVPFYVWLVLFALQFLLFISWFRMRKSVFLAFGIIAGIVGLAVLAVAASQHYAATPQISGDNSIAVLEKVELNGSEQWITIRGKDVNKPILLYLGIGGPGAGGFPANALTLKPLEDHFVVVNWDQPGTGKSYGAVPISTLTVDRFVADAHALTEYLCQRFDRDKIYVMGLSWGTILGTKLVYQHPERYYAYIGTGQMVNTVENDRLGYQLSLELAAQKGDQALLQELRSYGEPPYFGEGMAYKYAAYNNVLFEHMGTISVQMVALLVPQFADEYGLVDKFNFYRGLVQSFTVVYPQLVDLDFTTQAAKMEVPMYFLVGRQDVNAMASLVERYYNVLEAPYKELIWLESGHGAGPKELRDAMLNHVLVNSPPL
jgi:pimeloyl-ACP methyl ester carboxylesterase